MAAPAEMQAGFDKAVHENMRNLIFALGFVVVMELLGMRALTYVGTGAAIWFGVSGAYAAMRSKGISDAS